MVLYWKNALLRERRLDAGPTPGTSSWVIAVIQQSSVCWYNVWPPSTTVGQHCITTCLVLTGYGPSIHPFRLLYQSPPHTPCKILHRLAGLGLFLGGGWGLEMPGKVSRAGGPRGGGGEQTRHSSRKYCRFGVVWWCEAGGQAGGGCDCGVRGHGPGGVCGARRPGNPGHARKQTAAVPVSVSWWL